MPKNCVFCRIVNSEIPADILAHGHHSVILKDKNPVAQEHFLVISDSRWVEGPDTHARNIAEASGKLVADVMELAANYGRDHLPNGYRIVINTGADAGQTVEHFHVHLIGGQKLKPL